MIKQILGKFSDKDREFMNRSCIFADPVYLAIETHHEQPIGFIEASLLKGELYVNIGVIPAARKRGIAKKMFYGLLDWFINTQFRAIIWTVHNENLKSIKLAQKLGLKEFMPISTPSVCKFRYFAIGKK